VINRKQHSCVFEWKYHTCDISTQKAHSCSFLIISLHLSAVPGVYKSRRRPLNLFDVWRDFRSFIIFSVIADDALLTWLLDVTSFLKSDGQRRCSPHQLKKWLPAGKAVGAPLKKMTPQVILCHLYLLVVHFCIYSPIWATGREFCLIPALCH
jgi:hypothetical protein